MNLGEITPSADGGEVTTQPLLTTNHVPRGEGTVVPIGDGGEGNTHEAQVSGTVDVSGQEVANGHSGGEPVNIDFREMDYEDRVKVVVFCRNGCGCSVNCAMQFSMKHYLLTHFNAQQMTGRNYMWFSWANHFP